MQETDGVVMTTQDPMIKTRQIVAGGVRKAILKYGVIPGLCVGPLLSVGLSFSGSGGLTGVLLEIVVVTLIFTILFSGIAAYSWWVMRRLVAKADAQRSAITS